MSISNRMICSSPQSNENTFYFLPLISFFKSQDHQYDTTRSRLSTYETGGAGDDMTL